ncbi:Prevent host death protein, Phd antitoxin [Crocosphaera watsonii WH 0005]|uniref:Prevent host death protein, Phd antitoxin n=6 Tax=Crocosphaera watsonii TaxID=263511 RepID=Q4C9Q4_CROWT|nr:hypothetical protein CwatDRAFT_6492 [Crocosphaera watsonii WH 8501]CCQ54911.1 Prevent host death protein, Phd antitoxin [Crocosphaera watsonii WH 0005]
MEINMIEALNKVMTKLEQLPESEQERIAKIILNEVEKQELTVSSSASFSLENQPFVGMWKDRKVIPSPKPTTWEDFFEKTPLPSEDFMEQRIDLPLQTREDLF